MRSSKPRFEITRLIEFEPMTMPKSNKDPGAGVEENTGPTESQTIEYCTMTIVRSLVIKEIVSFHCGVAGDKGLVHSKKRLELEPTATERGSSGNEIHDPCNSVPATVTTRGLLPLLVTKI